MMDDDDTQSTCQEKLHLWGFDYKEDRKIA